MYLWMHALYKNIAMSIYACMHKFSSMVKLPILPFKHSIEAWIVTADANWTDDQLFSQIRLKWRHPEAGVSNICCCAVDWCDKVPQSSPAERGCKPKISTLGHSSFHQFYTIDPLRHYKLYFPWTDSISHHWTINTICFTVNNSVCHWEVRVVDSLDIWQITK